MQGASGRTLRYFYVPQPKLYEHLKAAAQEASDLIKSIQSGQQRLEGSLDNMLKSGHSFVSCVRYLMEDTSIERLNRIENLEEKMEEITRTVLHHVKNYLGNPDIGETTRV